MHGCGMYEKEGVKGGLAPNICSKQYTSGKQDIPMESVPLSELQEFSYLGCFLDTRCWQESDGN